MHLVRRVALANAVFSAGVLLVVWLLREEEAAAETTEGCRRRGCKLNINTMRCVCSAARPVYRPSLRAGYRPPSSTVQPTTVQWVTIPGGSFQMGSSLGESDEKPEHQVTVANFQMGKSEVTVGQYRKCVQAGSCTAPDTGTYCNWGKSGREDHPVNCVEWDQAKAFGTWAGGRLPSEPEWEYAARSGGKNQQYPWGDEAPTCRRAVMDDGGHGCGRDSTWPVCSKAAGNTAQGLCDMAGNVWEWVQDWYHETYAGAPNDGRAWESPTGASRVYRGGSWTFASGFLRASYRLGFGPDGRPLNLGFRLARSIPGAAPTEPPRVEVAAPVQPTTVQPTTVQWVTIPGGSFLMGSSLRPNETPEHRVTVASFQLGKSEVTVGQYRKCVQAGSCTAPETGRDCNWGETGREDHPVNCVDWSQAKAFGTWAGGRLPSEAEWEFAARSGGKNQQYPWGDEAPSCGRVVMKEDGDGCGRKGTWPVCAKSAGNTAQGLCDMAGNVREWVQDWYHETYTGAPTDGRAWERPTGVLRVDRSGSWGDDARDLRAAYRDWNRPGNRNNVFLGFRPARSSPSAARVDPPLRELPQASGTEESDPGLPGKLGAGDIRSGVNGILGQARGCYNRYRVAGTCTIRVVVSGSTGRVSGASVTGEFQGTATGQCVEQAFAKATFKKFKSASQSFVFPIIFR